MNASPRAARFQRWWWHLWRPSWLLSLTFHGLLAGMVAFMVRPLPMTPSLALVAVTLEHRAPSPAPPREAPAPPPPAPSRAKTLGSRTFRLLEKGLGGGQHPALPAVVDAAGGGAGTGAGGRTGAGVGTGAGTGTTTVRPTNVSEHALDTEAIYRPDPHLPDLVKLQRRGTGEARFAAKLCISTAGAVSSIDVLESIAGADEVILATLRKWRYRPQPIPVCFVARWIFSLE